MTHPTVVARNCLRAPIPEISEASRLLDVATSEHLMGHAEVTAALIQQANMPVIREWAESLWGANSPYVPSHEAGAVPPVVNEHNVRFKRMPTVAIQIQLHHRDGYHCRFCGIPVIRRAVRQRFCTLYPHLLIWGRRNSEQHAAFQTMWAQYDHIVPYAHGGGSDLDNLVVTCAPCNFGRMDSTLEEANLLDPRTCEPFPSSWDGLERFR
jgi:hypothetical protein